MHMHTLIKYLIFCIFIVQVVHSIDVIVVGRSNIGKTTLIKSLTSSKITDWYEWCDKTKTIKLYTSEYIQYNQKINFYDTPGLTGNIDDVIHVIGQTKSIDLMIICVDLLESTDDKKLFETLKKAYGPYIMKYAMIIFTKGNNINDSNTIAMKKYLSLDVDIPYHLVLNNSKDLLIKQIIQTTQWIWKYNDTQSYQLKNNYIDDSNRPELSYCLSSDQKFDTSY